MLLLPSSGPDLEAQQLAALQQRYPGIKQLCVAYGSWQWMGFRSLWPWAATLTVLEANNTSFPATALLPSMPPWHHKQLQSAAAPLLSRPAGIRPACAMPAANARQGAHPPQQQQRQGWQLVQQQAQTPSVVFVPPELQGLTRLQLQQVVTTPVKCRTHGSSDCRCWVSDCSISSCGCMPSQPTGGSRIDIVAHHARLAPQHERAILAFGTKHVNMSCTV